MVQSLIYKNIKILITVFFLFVFVFNINICLAADNLDKAFDSNLKSAVGSAGYKTAGSVFTVDSMISFIITTVLSFLGVIFLVLAIYGGYIWMMARGNEQEVEKAKQIIQNSIIGLIIVVAAYAISWYIMNAFSDVLI